MENQSCGACSHRRPNKFYETCAVLASKHWQRDGKVSPILPFWAHGPQATRQPLVPDMTNAAINILQRGLDKSLKPVEGHRSKRPVEAGSIRRAA